MDYRYGRHTVDHIAYHVVWGTTYRDTVLPGAVALRVRELVRPTCAICESKMLQGGVRQDHVHLLVSAPPHMAPSESMCRRAERGSHLVAAYRTFPPVGPMWAREDVCGLLVQNVGLFAENVGLRHRLFAQNVGRIRRCW